jgi:REP element-mobilizing transposase RayT
MPKSHTNLLYHAVFSTKGRNPWLAPEIRPRLAEYTGGVLRNDRSALLAAGGVEDHVHLLIRARPDVAPADMMRSVKASSSGWIHRAYPELSGFAWQSGYSMFSVSASQVDRVKRYLAGQEDHHRRMSFREELEALLQAHRVEFDERDLED